MNKQVESDAKQIVSLMSKEKPVIKPKLPEAQNQQKMIKSIAKKIMTPPKPDKGKNAPSFQVYEPNNTHQMDLLTLPNDQGFKYLLVVVDIATKKIDAYPLREKSSEAVTNGLTQIYKAKILKQPKRIECDQGGEFKKDFEKKFGKDLNIIIRRGKPGRHRQQGLVERANQTLGYLIFKKQLYEELEKNKTSTDWLHMYRKIITKLNTKAKQMQFKDNPPDAEGNSLNLLDIGTKVLVPEEEPRSIEGYKYVGRFRKTDRRYELLPRVVKEVILKPNQPPLYLVATEKATKFEPVAYTKNQLMLLTDNEYNYLLKFKK